MPGLYKHQLKRKRPTLNSSVINETSVFHSTAITDTTNDGNEDEEGVEGSTGNEPDISLSLSPIKRPTLGEGVLSQASQSQVAGPSTGTRALQNVAKTAEPVIEDSNSEDLFEEDDPGTREPDNVSQDSQSQRMHLSSRYGPVVINPPCGHMYFASILHKNGFILALPKNHLLVDVAVFRKNMEEWLAKNDDENSRIETETSKFLKAMENYFATKENLHHSCTTTLNDKEYIQPSLLHCLLGVKFVQVRLRRVITPLLSEASFSNAPEDAEFVGTLMSQLKWLPTLLDGKTFAKGLMEIFEDATIPVQRHMVRFLPEIFLPEFHPDLVPTLMATFDLGTQVNVSMLDCFSSLVIPESDCIRIRRSAVDQMASAPLADLPAYLSFLLRVGSEITHLEEGINEMREKLEINPSPIGKTDQKDVQQHEVVERIRFCVSVNPLVMKLWISKIKDDMNCSVELKTLDLIMLLIFVEAKNKSATKILNSVFCDYTQVNKLFDKMIECNKPMVNQLFPTIASFIDEVFRTRDMKCHEAATDIVKKIFVCVGPIKSDHLMTNLIGVLINGHPICREIALKTLTKVAETEPEKLLYFHHHLMGALVYVIKFPPRQMQALMNILAILAFVPKDHRGQENTFTVEFMILLRKQITHTNFQTRCFGVLGTVAAVKQLASQSNEQDKINELLELAWESTEKDEEACGILFDELASCADILPMDTCQRFREAMKLKFQAMWTLDQSSDSQLLRSSRGQAELELEPTFDANKEMQRDQLIIVLEPEALQMSPLVVPSHLRVMAELEKKAENGAVEGVDAVLGCPVFFPKITNYYEQENLDEFTFNQRTHLGQYLVITINYFRELVSAFVGSENPELRVKVWLRLNNIVMLEKMLVKHFESFPSLPPAYGTEKTMMASSSGAGFSGALIQGKKTTGAGPGTSKIKPKADKSKIRKGNKKKAKKGKKGSEDDDEEGLEQEDSEDVGSTSQKINLEALIQPKKVLSHLRRFNKSAFSLLKYPLTLSTNPVDYTGILLNLSSATQSASTMQQIEKFTPEALGILLIEMKQQVTDGNHSFDILTVDELLNSLCSHIDAIAEQNKIINTDQEQQLKVESCLRLLLSSMKLYIDAISNLKDKERRKMMTEQTVLTLASRYKSSSQEEDDELPTQIELLSNVANYLSEFKNIIVQSRDCEAAEVHIKLLKAVHDLLPRQDHIKKAMGETLKFYLRRAWKPRLSSSVIDFFLKTWLSVSPCPLKIVKQLIKHLIWSEDKQQKIPNCSVYQSCSATNFHTWYSALFAGLAQHVHKSGRRRGDYEDSIEFWLEAIELFRELVQVTKQIQKPVILLPLLKHSRVYIEAFISGGTCLLPQLWNQNNQEGIDAAATFTKSLQESTRTIQNICEHSKVIKDNQLMRLVPLLKRVLETLVFRVREALADYGAAGAFWMGTLKHRDLYGKVISSQMVTNEEQDEDSSSDEDEERSAGHGGLLPAVEDEDEDEDNDNEEDSSPLDLSEDSE